MHPTTLIPYPIFTKKIVDHILTQNPDIPNRLHEHYHRDPDPRLEPESHKERLEVKKSADLMIIDEEDEEESAGYALIRRKGKGVDKEELQELTASDPIPSSSKPTTSSPKPKSDRVKQYKSVFKKMSRRYRYMFIHLKQSFMQKKDFKAITKTVHATFKKVVPSMVDKTLNDIMKKNLPKIVADRIRSERQKVHNDLATLVADAAKKERESIRAELFSQVTHDVANIVPSQMKDDERARDNDLAVWLSLKIKFEKPIPLVEPYRVATVHTRNHEDHDDDDARTQEQLEDFDAWQDGQGTDDDDVPDEEVSPELLDEVSRKVLTSDELQRMQDALNDMLRNKCDSGEEHQYHLDQMQIYMES
ncbi:hypothetical protein Tco_1445597 [Tanacetum coccineum]